MHDTVILLASGPSVKQYNLRNLESRGTLIAISGAALYVKPHIAFTMDRLVAELCYPLWLIQGVPRILIRECIVKNFKVEPHSTQLFQHDGPATQMTLAPGKLNGSNTGACALNLAYQMTPRRVFLLGYDMQRGPLNEPYWHPPYPWNTAGAAKNGKLAEWALEFREIARQFRACGIQVFNVNHRSKIDAFQTISFDSFEKMT